MNFGKKDPTKRDLVCAAVVGKKGNGKSSLMAEIAEIYMDEMLSVGKENPKYLQRAKVLIFVPMPTISRAFQKYKEITLDELVKGVMVKGKRRRWVRGIRYIKPPNEDIKTLEAYMLAITKHFKNGLWIMDEANSWLKKTGDLPKWQLLPFTQHRNFSVEIYFCCHRLRDVKQEIRGHFWKYVIFKSNESPVDANYLREHEFPENCDEMAEMFMRVRHTHYEPDEQVQYFEIFDAAL